MLEVEVSGTNGAVTRVFGSNSGISGPAADGTTTDKMLLNKWVFYCNQSTRSISNGRFWVNSFLLTSACCIWVFDTFHYLFAGCEDVEYLPIIPRCDTIWKVSVIYSLLCLSSIHPSNSFTPPFPYSTIHSFFPSVVLFSLRSPFWSPYLPFPSFLSPQTAWSFCGCGWGALHSGQRKQRHTQTPTRRKGVGGVECGICVVYCSVVWHLYDVV